MEPRIQEQQCGFRPGRGTLDQLFTFSCPLGQLGELPFQSDTCFVDLVKAFDQVFKVFFFNGDAAGL